MSAGHSNPLIQKIQKVKTKLPDADRHFILEGARLILDAERSGISFQALFYTEAWKKLSKREEILARLRQKIFPCHLVSRTTMESLSLEDTPPGLLAFGQFSEPSFLADGKNIVLLSGVQDPGNAGTLFRVAEGTGSAVWFSEESVRPFHPKVVKASMGSIFRVPSGRGDAIPHLDAWKKEGRMVVGTKASGGTPHASFDWRKPFVLLLGNEAAGLPPALDSFVDGYVTIPLQGELDSLNVAVAGAVLLFEAQRQRQA